MAFLSKYSKLEIEYYQQIAFKEDKIRKWDEDIVIYIDPKFDDQFKKFAARIIFEVDSLIPNLKINISDKNYNIQILYEDNNLNTMGAASTKLYFLSSKIKSSIIWLSPLNSKNELRFNFCHELMHAFGLYHTKKFQKTHSLMGYNMFKSIEDFEVFRETFHSIPSIDKKALEIHYNECIESGLSKKDLLLLINQSLS